MTEQLFDTLSQSVGFDDHSDLLLALGASASPSRLARSATPDPLVLPRSRPPSNSEATADPLVSDAFRQARTIGASQVALEISALGNKYRDSLYVPRDSAYSAFASFLADAAARAVLYIGDSGAGKSNLLCGLARETAKRQPTLLLRSSTVPTDRPYSLALAVSEALGIHPTTLRTEAILATIAARCDLDSTRELIVFLDAINEARDREAFANCLGETLAVAATFPMRFCISCRTPDWRLFREDARITGSLWSAPGEPQQEFAAVPIAHFSAVELRLAWARYSECYGLAGDLSSDAATVCAHPLMLRLVSEAFRGRALPSSLETCAVFDEYWRVKIEGKPDRVLALYRLVAEMRARGATMLTEEQVFALLDRGTYDALISEGVVMCVRVDRNTGIRLIGFTYEAFGEYTLARHIMKVERWDLMTPGDRRLGLTGLMGEERSNRSMGGVVEFVLLAYDDSPDVDAFVEIVAGGPPEWRRRCCTVLPRLKRFGDRFLSVIRRLAMDEDYWTRWAAAFALVQLPIESRPSVLDDWAASGTWQVREASAHARAHCGDGPYQLARLRALAEDDHWRVRRAVAYALNRHLALGSIRVEEVLPWTTADSWKVRDVAIISQRDLEVDVVASVGLLGGLVEDPNERIRFSVAKFVSLIPWSVDSERILKVLALDRSGWVRKRVASSVCVLSPVAPTVAAEILSLLAVDPELYVRWQVARAVGDLSGVDRKVVESLLQRLESDAESRVREGAKYSQRLLRGEVSRSFTVAIGQLPGFPLAEAIEAIARVSNLVEPSRSGLVAASAIFRSWKSDYYLGVVGAIQMVAAQVGTAGLGDLVRSLLSDAEEGVRWAVLEALVRIEAPCDMYDAALGTLLRDPQVWVRQNAVERLSLESLRRRPSLAGAIRDLAVDGDAHLRTSVALAVRRLESELGAISAELLRSLANDGDSEVRRAAREGGVA